jgi:hypothetical protein
VLLNLNDDERFSFFNQPGYPTIAEADPEWYRNISAELNRPGVPSSAGRIPAMRKQELRDPSGQDSLVLSKNRG